MNYEPDDMDDVRENPYRCPKTDRYERELDRADYLRDVVRHLERELAEAREQLAAARAEIDEIHATGGCSYIELHKVTEQRDRLAEALQELWDNHTLHGAAYELIERTLAAVKGEQP
jgi:cupin superfamily acireductone dioxygenase involved in methionine salvage